MNNLLYKKIPFSLIALALVGCGTSEGELLLPDTKPPVELPPIELPPSERPPVQPVVKPIDLIITLGMQLNYESCTPREILRHRVSEAARVYGTLENPIIMAVGKGNETSIETCVDNNGITEALVIKQLLINDHGIPEEHILLQAESSDTETHASESKKITDKMRENGIIFNSMNLVSSHYDMYKGDCWGTDESAILAFNEAFGAGTFNSQNTYTSGTFSLDENWSSEFTFYNGWSAEDKEGGLFIGDVDGSGRGDIIAVKGIEVHVALSNGSHFDDSSIWSSALPDAGAFGRKILTGDFSGNGKEDILAITEQGIYIAQSTGTQFLEPELWSIEFTLGNGWDVTIDQFNVIDYNGNGYDDIAVFAEDGVYVALSTGQAFSDMVKVTEQFGHDDALPDYTEMTYRMDQNAGPLSIVKRAFGDVTGNGLADIIIFGAWYVHVAEQQVTGGYAESTPWLYEYVDDTVEGDLVTLIHLKWNNNRAHRDVVDMTGNGIADIAGIGQYDLIVAHSSGQRFESIDQYGETSLYTNAWRTRDFSYDWSSFVWSEEWTNERHTRIFADVTGNGLNDMVGFGDTGVIVSKNIAP